MSLPQALLCAVPLALNRIAVSRLRSKSCAVQYQLSEAPLTVIVRITIQ